MLIFMWSGPRNLSTALMRSFENRKDTKVIDSRLVADGSQIKRRRSCEICDSRFTTFRLILSSDSR